MYTDSYTEELMNGAGGLYGRIQLEWGEPVTADNVVEVVQKLSMVHDQNILDTTYLYRMYRGRIDSVINRKKYSVEQIRNVAIVGYAGLIADFQTSHFLGDQVICTNDGEESLSDSIETLNKMFKIAGKQNSDKLICEDFCICGNSYRFIQPNKRYEKDKTEVPFIISPVSPQRAFVVYSTAITQEPIAGVIITPKSFFLESANEYLSTYSVYTDEWYFEVAGGEVRNQLPNTLGLIPLIEFKNNEKRLGSFETVHTLIDKISMLTSERLDGAEQMANQLLIGKNTNLGPDQTQNLKIGSLLQFPSSKENPADMKFISAVTNQSDEQVLFDNIHDIIFAITSMPHSSGKITTMGNVGSSYISGGWQAAETKAKGREDIWRESEFASLKIILKICHGFGLLKDLTVYDVGFKFTRRHYEDIQNKAQTLKMLLPENFYVDPESSFAASGLFVDSQTAYTKSREYTEVAKAELAKEMAQADTVEVIDENITSETSRVTGGSEYAE